MNKTSADAYLRDGCGRCDRYQTAACKVHLWTDALKGLRTLLLDTGLVEEMKWGSPCYTLNGKNVVMLVSLRDCCALSFFKGAALSDEEGVLESPGASSRYLRQLKYRSFEEVTSRHQSTLELVQQAIALERAGVKVEVGEAREPMPAELEERLASDPALMSAFEALTPGRQRSHILHISGAKQAETRERRVEKCAPVIFAGKGFNER